MFFNCSSQLSTKMKIDFQPTRATLIRKSKNIVSWAFFHFGTEEFGETVKKELKIIPGKMSHLLDDFPSLLSGRLVPFKARRVLLLPLTTSGGSRYNLWWMMIINIDYDDDHGFDDGDNDVTSSPPSSTDHLWWYLRWCSSWLSWSYFLVKKYLFLVIVLHWEHGVIS